MPAHREGEAGTGAGVCRRAPHPEKLRASICSFSAVLHALDCRNSLVPLPVTLRAAALELATTSKVEMEK
jgi:hypothetical protein